MTTKRQELETHISTARWFNNRVPTVVTAAEAHIQQDGHHFYTVAWWGTDEKPLPAGFTRFDFVDVVGDGYTIIWRDEPRDREGKIGGDDLILMFDI